MQADKLRELLVRADDVDRAVRSGRKFYFQHNPANTMLAQIFNDILQANGTFEPGMTEHQRREDAALKGDPHAG